MTQLGVTSLWQRWRGGCANMEQWTEWCQRVKSHILKKLACNFYQSHRQPHTERHKGYKLLPVSAHTLQVNKRQGGWKTLPLLLAYTPGLPQCHFHFTVSHCTNHSSFPLPWRLLLCGSSQSAVSSSLTQHSLWPNGGEGVFMAKSGPFSLSGATQDSL